MLSDLSEIQESDEEVWHIKLSFDIETRSTEGDEIVHKTYTFAHAKEWDSWHFHEYHEERSPNTDAITDRDWTRSRHILWQDINESQTIDVPPEVARALQEATGADEIVIQAPAGSITEDTYDKITVSN